VIKYSGGAVRTEKQANYALIGLVAFAMITALFLMFRGGGPELPSRAEIERDTPRSSISPQ
jgi:succinate-acetate transporter protein